jgi:aspartyl-tRNA(Asn)/glutamyl-tRNA(Gln) amidotransferase subunit C
MLKPGGNTTDQTREISGIDQLLSAVARRSHGPRPWIQNPSNYLLKAASAAPFAMSLTLSDVKRIAHLAQLDMDDAHAETALAELNGIFALAEQMQAVDTSGVAPLSHPLAALRPLPLRLREDVITEENRRDEYLGRAPKAQDGLFLVPKVIE